VPPRFEAGAEFDIIEDLTIANYPQGFIFVVNGLVAAEKIDAILHPAD